MKDEYILYLDESEFKKSKIFAIAGIAIKKENISLLEQGIEEIKKLIWSEEYIISQKPTLHCVELQKVFLKRESGNISNVNDAYQEFIKLPAENIKKIYHQVYGRLSQVLKKAHATVFSCIIKTQQLHDLFFLDETHNGISLIDDKYNIALQQIIENYTHYLSLNDGFGSVVYESRNTIGDNSAKSPDIKLVNAYHKILANNKGIVYTNNITIQNRNRTIVVYPKSDNLAGLQFADFVANNILKFETCRKVEQQVTDFMKQIHKRSYNGGYSISKDEHCSENDHRSFWGMRVLPPHFKIEELTASNKSLKNANDKLKKERKNIKKTIDIDKERIKQLEKQVELLKEENKNLKNQKKSVDTDSNN